MAITLTEAYRERSLRQPYLDQLFNSHLPPEVERVLYDDNGSAITPLLNNAFDQGEIDSTLRKNIIDSLYFNNPNFP